MKGSDAVAGMSLEDLYLMETEEASFHKGLIDVFLSTPSNSDAIFSVDL